MFVLDDKELADLTGAKIRRLQIQNLRDNDIPFTEGIDGKPKVLHSVLIEKALGGFKGKQKKQKQPDFSKVNF
jgi:hypothetical protein